MATRKAPPKQAPEKQPGTAMVDWKEELKARARKATEIEKNASTGVPYIKLRGGQITLEDMSAKDNRINVVVLGHTIEYAMYGGDYDADAPQSPICFAFGEDEAEMAPHDLSVEKQHDNCRECPMNKFGSADRGAGKACKNIRRLIMIAEDDLDDLDKAKFFMLKVPVTSVKNWTAYVRKLESQLELPPLAVITEITTKPDPKSQFKVLFSLVEEIEDGDQIGALLKLADSVDNDLKSPYTSTGEAEEPAPKKNSKLARRDSSPARARTTRK
jgi:hypothetical protein